MTDPKILTLEVLPARKGDSLLLHYGTRARRKLWVIDGGPSNVYKPVLKKRLNALRGQDTLEIELLMVSHHDDDHIKGVLELCQDIETAQGQKPYTVRNLWHNSFQRLVDLDEVAVASVPAVVTAQLAGDEHDAAMLASVGQGHDLGRIADRFDWPVNLPFKGHIAGLGRTAKSKVTRFKPLDITMIGPMKDEVDALREVYRTYLKKLEEGDEAGASAALASYSDKSPANLSSIVALVKHGGKSILLTGDARGDKILIGLRALGLVDGTRPLEVDVLKMPHHGSDRNIEPDFFETISARHYVFCGDGSHGNPERATLEMLFALRAAEDFTLHFNHPIADIDSKRREEFDKKHKDEPEATRPQWDPARDDIGTFIEQQRQTSGAKFKVVEAEAKGDILVLNLLDPLDG